MKYLIGCFLLAGCGSSPNLLAKTRTAPSLPIYQVEHFICNSKNLSGGRYITLDIHGQVEGEPVVTLGYTQGLESHPLECKMVPL